MELDNPVWWALQGSQRSLGEVRGGAARFLPEVSPFGGFEGRPGPADWQELARITGPGSTVALIGTEEGQCVPPDGWTVSWTSPGVQMVGGAGWVGRAGPPPDGAAMDPAVPLGPDDVEDMLALVSESRPGPFSSRTVEFGGYVGIRREGQLVAMAGERLRPPGYAEISAVTTHPDHRRQGLAERLVGTVGAGITGRGEAPFLHAAAGNTNAIRLYGTLGFTVRRTVWFTALEVSAG
jgi:ribosomal protein S18 acetylase RimI-like enzyme